MSRVAVRASAIQGDPSQYAGTINVEKCIKYLRGIGVEVSDQDGDSWLITQATHRLLKGMKGAELVFWRHYCDCGEMQGLSIKGRGARRWITRRKKQIAIAGELPAMCEECGGGWHVAVRVYEIARDGTETDYRSAPENVVPFNWRELLEQ